jgi:hypothetical protein
MSNKICAENIITNNCTLVKGPDNKLHLLLPVAPEVVEKINATSVPAQESITDEAVADAPNEPGAEEITEAPQRDDDGAVPRNIQEWIVTESGSAHNSTHRLTHRLDHRTFIELWDHHDGFGSVRRCVKPRFGKSKKDHPLRNRPIALCLERISEWISEGPQSWTSYEDRGSVAIVNRRRKQTKLYNSLFKRR